MKSRLRPRNERAAARCFLAVSCLAAAVGALVVQDTARAEERKFGVIMAHSPKAFVTGGQPGLPPGGLHNVEEIRKDYFDRVHPDIDSFVEYWEEISYGDVVITGDVLGWVTLPWAFEPVAPNAPDRPSPADFIDLLINPINVCTLPGERIPPTPYAYGAGEEFCDCVGIGGSDTAITLEKCGALIITDLVGDPTSTLADPKRGPGMSDSDAVGINVWTPGERFVDIDADDRWDGIDEKNDLMCHGSTGCRNICSGMVCSDFSGYCSSDAQCPAGTYCKRGTLVAIRCATDADCPQPNEVCGDRVCDDGSGPCMSDADCLPGVSCVTGGCGGLPGSGVCTTDADCEPDVSCVGSGPRGCDWPGCGDLLMPCVDWNESDDCDNPGGNDPRTEDGCTPFDYIPCLTGAECPPGSACLLDLVNPGVCLPMVCYPQFPDSDIDLPECCRAGLDTGPDSPLAACVDDGGVVLCSRYSEDEYPNCVDDLTDPTKAEGVICGEPRYCCEFDDFDRDGQIDVAEPFEDFIIRYEPAGQDPNSVWAPVSRDYIRDNYPGDVDALLMRVGNGYYDSPDLFFDVGSTKMMQDAGNNRFAWATPEPGTRYPSGAPNFETPWFGSFWSGRYGSTPPPWPTGTGGSPDRNTPTMRPFDPDEPTPPIARLTPGRRWFQSNRGGWTGYGHGSAQDPTLEFDLGGDAWEPDILPEEEFGYYDGWVEHDDLPSSKYHSEGDKRLGEITSPSTDTVTVPGTDDGEGNEVTYTAIFGADLGKNNPLIGADNRDPDNYCVAAGPGAVNIHGEKGFDAGDVCILEWLTWRTDGDHVTIGSQWEADNGSYHPFAGPSTPRIGGPVGFRDYNLDGMIDQGEVRPELSENYSADSDPFTNPNDGSGTNYPFNRRRVVEDVVEALDPSVDWDDFVVGNRVSGIVLAPLGAFTDSDLFPYGPGNFTISTQDRSNTLFQYMVECQDCEGQGDFPSAVRSSAHHYLDTWEGFPVLYDQDVFDDPPHDVINCPIGDYDIRASGGLVHSIPILKERAGWIEAVDLESALTPGVETTLTLPPAEFVRDRSYFYLQNSERTGERYYFWSAGSGFDERFPGEGMLVLRSTDHTANEDALAVAQRTPPFNFAIVEADGRGDLEACSSSGNRGDAGDFWPGSTGATEFNFNTDPSATWNRQNRWTGLDISNIQTDGAGSVRLTLSWVPTNIPSLRFIDPPGGESVGSTYQVRFEATDVYGGTTIALYYTADEEGGAVPSAAGVIGSRDKGSPGSVRQSINWNIGSVPDGRYFVFAKLIPGSGSGGTERKFTDPRGGRNNRGNGTLSNLIVDVSSNINSTARSEAWTVLCIDADGQEWRVNSSLTQPDPSDPSEDPYPHASTCPYGTADCSPYEYSSAGDEVKFIIKEGSVPFKLDDSFTFTTTGITAMSKGVTILGGRISGNPTPVINAGPELSGRPPLTVDFDARDSSDPEGQPLSFQWDFGDGESATGPAVSHTFRVAGIFTVVLRATDPFGRFGEATVDIHAINNSPSAVISADPSSGPAPLTVRFDGSGSHDTETAAERLIYRWDFGDGKSANEQGLPGILINPEHYYSADSDGKECTSEDPCMFNATLTVTDSEDRPGAKSDTATIEIMVGNSNPVANISVSPTRGSDPLEVTFNALASSDPEGDDLEVLWKWGDGSEEGPYPITGRPGVTNGDVIHEYALAAGQTRATFHPTATLTDHDYDFPVGDPSRDRGGETIWSGQTITVTQRVAGSSDPIAKFTIDPEPPLELDEEFVVDASESYDRPIGAENRPLTYTWDFDDGGSGTGKTDTHTYTKTGTYVITLVVTDALGNADRKTKTVQVVTERVEEPTGEENLPPTVKMSVTPGEGYEDVTEFTFDAAGSTDPDGDDSKLTYSWTFGDGKSATGKRRTHTYEDPGTYVVRLTVSDEHRAAVHATETIVVLSNVGNREPVAIISTGPRSGPAPLTLTFSGRNSYDLDGDSLEFTWEFRQGETLIETKSGAAATMVFDTVGTYSVELMVDDGRLGVTRTDRETIQVTTAVLTEPPPPVVVPGGEDGERGSSYLQRPGGRLCGLGMLTSLFGLLLGLSVMRFVRLRRP